MDLRVIQEHEGADATHYFPDYEQGPLYLAVALAGEVGEACNEIKKWARGDFDRDHLKELLEGELPDTLIYLVMLAEEMDIDLETAYHDKKVYNERRFRKSEFGVTHARGNTGGIDPDTVG